MPPAGTENSSCTRIPLLQPNCTCTFAPPQLHLFVTGEALALAQAPTTSSGGWVSDVQSLGPLTEPQGRRQHAEQSMLTCGWCEPSSGVARAEPRRLPGLGAAVGESIFAWNSGALH